MSFSFKYGVDGKNEGKLVQWFVKACALTPLAGWFRKSQDRGGPPEDLKKLQLLFVVMPVCYLYVEMYVLETNILKMHLTGCQHKKSS